MYEYWLVFRHEGRELCSYTLRGTFQGEKEATIQQLAAEKGIPAEEITCSIISRKKGAKS